MEIAGRSNPNPNPNPNLNPNPNPTPNPNPNQLCAQLLATAEQTGAKGCLPEAAGSYTGDETWYDGFGSFLGPRK